MQSLTDKHVDRILVIDDNPAIHEDFRKILLCDDDEQPLMDAEAAFFGNDAPAKTCCLEVELDVAHQGQEGCEKVRAAIDEGRPYTMAFVDMRMPPGWDGLETIERLWKADPELQVVLCTAFSDHSWADMYERLGSSDQLLVLKKPFDAIEIRQMASALIEKWNATAREHALIEELTRTEREVRAYATSLETVNRAMMTSRAVAERAAESRASSIFDPS